MNNKKRVSHDKKDRTEKKMGIFFIKLGELYAKS